MSKPPAVLIVGAGPVGLVMAIELSRHGIPCRILDQGSGPSSKSKAVSVHSRTLEIFESMGVLDAAMQRGRRLRGLSWHSGTRRVAHITFEGMDTPYSFELGISQCDTEEALVEHLLQLGVTVERRVRWYYAPIARTRGKDAWDEHAELIGAIARRNSRRAADLMRRHTERTREIYQRRRQEAEHGG